MLRLAGILPVHVSIATSVQLQAASIACLRAVMEGVSDSTEVQQQLIATMLKGQMSIYLCIRLWQPCV